MKIHNAFIKTIALVCFSLSLTTCSLVGNLLAFTEQDIDAILNLVQSNGCQVIDASALEGLVSAVGDDVLEVFGIEEEDVLSRISAFSDGDQSSVCVMSADVEGSTTHRAYFFSFDDDLAAQNFNASDIQITETMSDGTTASYQGENVAVLSDFAADIANTAFSFSSVMDYSGSMSDEDLENLEIGLDFLYDNLPDNFSSEIVKFASNVEVTQEYTDDNSLLATAVTTRTISRSATALFDGLHQGLSDTSLQTNSLKLVIGFTDGLENSSDRTRADVVTVATDNDIPLILIGMGTIVDLAELQSLANDTGGFFFYAPTNDMLDVIFTRINEFLSNTHVVTWTSTASSGVSTVSIAAGGVSGSI